MTGGIGHEALTAFYRDHFIFKCAHISLSSTAHLTSARNPSDTSLELISRTVGPDRVIDEFVTHLTHDSEVDWLLPGVPPTGRRLAVPMVAVVLIRGDRLAHGASSCTCVRAS
jgi:carboxymethylenebutenolidase